MVFNFIKIAYSFILSLALLAGSTGIGMFMHFCKGELVETSFYTKASCEVVESITHNHEGECISKSLCCEDENFLLKTSDYETVHIKLLSQIFFSLSSIPEQVTSFQIAQEQALFSRPPPQHLYSKTSKYIQEGRLLI